MKKKKNLSKKVQEEREKKTGEEELEQLDDLIQLFTKPVGEMSDEELDEALKRMAGMRKTKIASRKKTDYLIDLLLPKLDSKTAERFLKNLEKDTGKTEKKEDEKKEDEKKEEQEKE